MGRFFITINGVSKRDFYKIVKKSFLGFLFGK